MHLGKVQQVFEGSVNLTNVAALEDQSNDNRNLEPQCHGRMADDEMNFANSPQIAGLCLTGQLQDHGENRDGPHYMMVIDDGVSLCKLHQQLDTGRHSISCPRHNGPHNFHNQTLMNTQHNRVHSHPDRV